MWTHGYDIYTPSQYGHVVYHNYTNVPVRFETISIDPTVKAIETKRGRNRFRLVVGMPFMGRVDARE